MLLRLYGHNWYASYLPSLDADELLSATSLDAEGSASARLSAEEKEARRQAREDEAAALFEKRRAAGYVDEVGMKGMEAAEEAMRAYARRQARKNAAEEEAPLPADLVRLPWLTGSGSCLAHAFIMCAV